MGIYIIYNSELKMSLYECIRRGMNPMAMMRNYQKANFLMQGNRVVTMQRDLVQWNLTAVGHHN